MERASERAWKRKKLPERRKREKERHERERSETEGRRIARGQNGKREQKTRENYGLPRSRPRLHGAHCLAGYLGGNIDPSLSLSFPSLPARPSTTSLTGTRRWRGRSSPLSPLVSAPAAERPYLHRTTSWWGVEYRASTPGGISRAQR